MQVIQAGSGSTIAGSAWPHALTSFVGRTHELACIEVLLRATRLVTLTGTGGVGKMRLAVVLAAHVANTYPGGVHMVELAPVDRPDLVLPAMLSALGLAEQQAGSPLTTLTSALQDKHALLVLDNCEHLVDACADIVQLLLRNCQHLRILTTAESVGLSEREVQVLRLLARGLSTKAIAEQLVISPKTAGSHIEHIYTKTGAGNRAQASVYALKHGLMHDI